MAFPTFKSLPALLLGAACLAGTPAGAADHPTRQADGPQRGNRRHRSGRAFPTTCPAPLATMTCGPAALSWPPAAASPTTPTPAAPASPG